MTIWTVPLVNTRGWSDQAPFAAAGVPTLLMNTGVTDIYHRMTDTPDRVNNLGGARAARLIFEMLLKLDEEYGRR